MARLTSPRRIGIHVSIAGGVEKAPDRAAALGCTAFQIFTRNPRGWAYEDLTDEACETFRRRVADLGLWPPVAHMPYLPNLASPDEEIHERSVETLLEEVRRCARLGIPYLVTHLGSHMGAGIERGRDRIRAALEAALGVETDVEILLENTAGTRNSCGTEWEELAALIDALGGPARLGVCLDTAHALAAGYEIDDARGVDEAVKAIDRTIGLDRVRCLHLNDSKVACSGRADRHEHLGRGHVGEAGLRAVLRHPRLAAIPALLETPIDRPGDDARNVAEAWRLAGASPPPVAGGPRDGGGGPSRRRRGPPRDPGLRTKSRRT